MADAHANFATSTVATAPSTPTAGTSLVVASGEGARFPTAPFNATVWAAGATPTPANAEIVRVTARSTDTLTITRAQEGTTARTIVVGDSIVAGITAKTLTDAEIGGVSPVSGRYYTTPVSTFATVTPGLNSLRATPIRLGLAATFSRIGLGIWSAGGAGSVVRLGIYGDTGGNPGSLILDAGTIDATINASNREITISQALAVGRYWLAAVAQIAAPNWYAVSASASNEVGGLAAPTNTWPSPAGVTASAACSGALPSTFGALAASNGDYQPLVYVKAA